MGKGADVGVGKKASRKRAVGTREHIIAYLACERVRKLPVTTDLDSSEVVLLQQLLSPGGAGGSGGGSGGPGGPGGSGSGTEGLEDARSLLS